MRPLLGTHSRSRGLQVTTFAAILALSASGGWAQTAGLVAIDSTASAARVKPSASSSAEYPDAPSYGLAPGAVQSSDGADEVHEVTIREFPRRIILDEWHALTSPARIRRGDLMWLVPLAGATAASFATDTRAMRDAVSKDPTLNSNAGTASDVIRDSFIGLPVALFGIGQFAHQERAREAGLLAGEAMIDAYAFGALIKVATFRERPPVDNSRGAFYQTSAGGDSSFPSGHSVVAWSSAAVLAEEYNRPWQQALVYTFAGGVSLSRVLSQQHFPSDALIGSACGWLIGHYVYRAHHRQQHP